MHYITIALNSQGEVGEVKIIKKNIWKKILALEVHMILLVMHSIHPIHNGFSKSLHFGLALTSMFCVPKPLQTS